jgi:Ni,Fe-hydrogenase III small subunit
MYHILKQIVSGGIVTQHAPVPAPTWHAERDRISGEVLAILGRALCIRQVDAGSCNACELEIHALNNPYYNIEALGIKFVASPRHADMLLVTGPVSKNMAGALKLAYEAVPDPKLVVATGACACTGGLFSDSYASCGRVSNVIPVDVEVPGCPPPPIDILRGILQAITSGKTR